MAYELEHNNNNDSYFNHQAYYLNENNEIQHYEDNGCQPELNVALNEDNITKIPIKELEDKISTKFTFHRNKFDLDNLNEKQNCEKKIKKKKTPKKKLGRKTKSSEEDANHTKYQEDNITRKIKCIVISILSCFLNDLIAKIYNNNIGKGIFKKELLKMNQNQIIDLKSNKEFINKKLKEIFSNEISSKFSCYPPEHNKLLVEELLNENDIEKRKTFENIFSLTFLECIKHIRGEINIQELDGIESLDKICEKFEGDDDYIKLLKYYFFHFEIIIMSKKSRKTK